MKALLRATALVLALSPALAGCKGEKELTPEEIAAKLESDLKEAEARVRNGKIKDAEKIYLRLLEENGEHPQALAGMALVRMGEQDYATAQVLLERAVAAGNNDHRTHFNLAEARRLQSDHAGAVEPYGKAFELQPENADYGLAKGIALKKSGNFAEAEKVLRQVSELDPNAMFVWTELGDVIREQGRLEEALKIYMKAQNTYASDKMARAGAALVYEGLKQNIKALNEWSAYIRMDCCSEYSNNVAKKKITELKATDAELQGEPEGEGEGEGEEAAG